MTRKVTGLLLALAAAVAAGLLFSRFSGEPEKGPLPVVSAPEVVEPQERVFPPAASVRATEPATEERRRAGTELRPGEVIDAGRCGMARGAGPASGLAAVVLGGASRSSPARFSVLDAAGSLMSGWLPSYPHRMSLGRTPEGEVVAGFGGIPVPNRAGGPGGLLMAADPLRIYVGDRIAYESRAVWMFGVASDGSSYFSIEPEGSVLFPPAVDSSARMAVFNRSYGTEARYDLGPALVDSDGFLAYQASYTGDNKEVHLEPLPVRRRDRGLGKHYFYSALGEAPPREIEIPDRGRYDVALFVSSKEGYIFYEASHWNAPLDIVRGRFTWGSDGERQELLSSESVWRRTGPVNTRADGVAVSPDGGWLLFRTGTAKNGRGSRPGDWGLYVLNTVTGDTVFHLPTDDPDAQIERLASVLPPQPAENDIGLFMGAFFAGDGKLVVERLEDVRDLESRNFYDVYDMNSISLDAQPNYRVVSNERRTNQCASLGFPGKLVEAEGGKLAYAPLQ